VFVSFTFNKPNAAKLLTAYLSLGNRVRVGEKKSLFQTKEAYKDVFWECFGQERKISSKDHVCKDKKWSTLFVYIATIKKGAAWRMFSWAGMAITKQTRVRPSHTWQLET
jgi:hypothetical protein